MDDDVGRCDVTQDEIKSLLGATDADVRALTRLPLAEARVGLEALKKRARKNLRKLTLELHPDRTGGDAAKTEQLRDLVGVYERLKKLVITERPRPQIAVHWHDLTTTSTISPGFSVRWAWTSVRR